MTSERPDVDHRARPRTLAGLRREPRVTAAMRPSSPIQTRPANTLSSLGATSRSLASATMRPFTAHTSFRVASTLR